MGEEKLRRADEETSPARRFAALAALVLAIALVAFIFFGGVTDPYQVKARFATGGQLVKGNPVVSSGAPVGSVSSGCSARNPPARWAT